MKKLPVVKAIEYSLALPLTGGEIVFRPYTVEDEKKLMAAVASKSSDAAFYIRNTMSILENTILNDVNLNTLPSAEVELYHLALRGKSSGEEIEFSFVDEDGSKKNVTVNTDAFYIEQPDKALYDIKITDDVHLKMKNITFSKRVEYSSKFKDNPTDSVFETIIDCVDSIYNPNDTKEFWKVGEDITIDELREFIFGLSGHSSKFYAFIKGLPKVAVKAVLSDGTTKVLDSNDIDFLS